MKMGNCNVQNCARRLGDHCSSSPNQRAKRRGRRRRGRACRTSSSSSSSSSSSGSDSSSSSPASANLKPNQAQDEVEVAEAAGAGPATSEEVVNQALEQDERPDETADSIERDQAKGGELEKQPANESSTIGHEESGDQTEAASDRLKRLKEGLDFIETEEDVKAVEAATLKIQSTFRGKKIRSKFGASKPAEEAQVGTSTKQVNKSAGQQQQQQQQHRVQEEKQVKAGKQSGEQTTNWKPASKHKQPDETSELSKRVGEMQVQDNTSAEQQPQVPGELAEEEAERAATKIQAGFKGYKTRKELEVGGKLPPAGSAGARQAAPPTK